MLGKIENFRRDIGVGVISAEDGSKYRFQRTNLINTPERIVGEEVDFVLLGRTPRDIVVLAGSPWAVFGLPSVTFSMPADAHQGFSLALAA
ncbi:MAG: hypothetical protein ABL907_25800 [Hyphomicrobium sp.]